MAFKVGDMVEWKGDLEGGLLNWLQEFGSGPFKVLSVKSIAVCTCGRSEAFNRDMEEGRLDPENDFDEIDFHHRDCELWHMGDETYSFTGQQLTIATGKGPQKIGTCLLQKSV